MDCSACIDIATMDAVNVGGLVGYCVNSNLTNCSSEGNIEVSGNHTFIEKTVGGLVGYGGIITSCCSSVNIKGEADYAGGLVGVNSTIKNSYANGNITLEKGRVGGLAGMCGTVENSYATGNIESLGEVGGLIGDIEDGGSIINCYATGSVSSGFESSFGGLFGNVDFANIINCYSTGKVIKIDDSSFYNLGGFGGSQYNNHDISGCFWDMEKSGQSFAIDNENFADDELKGLSTSDFSNPDTFINAGWDEDVWDFSGSTPTLKVEMFSKENTDSSTLTGSVNTNGMTDTAFDGQSTGQLSFSNGVNVNISATDTRSEVLEKINDAGLNASIGTDGKIKITAEGVSDLTITSDTSGFSNFYGLDNTEDIQTGNITITTETVPAPDGGSTGGDGGDGSGTGGTAPDNPDGGGTGGTDAGKTPPVGALRLQIGADSTESSAIYVDTEFDLGEFEVDFTSADSCASAIEDIDEALSEINRKRAEFGAVINRINTILTTQTITIQNYSASKSTIMDADIATESAEYVKNQILQQTSSTLLAQSENLHSSIIMSLIS